MKLGLDAGPQPPLAGDELKALTDGTHQDRLKHAMLPQRVGQRGNILRVK